MIKPGDVIEAETHGLHPSIDHGQIRSGAYGLMLVLAVLPCDITPKHRWICVLTAFAGLGWIKAVERNLNFIIHAGGRR